jgi:hypothetical protein
MKQKLKLTLREQTFCKLGWLWKTSGEHVLIVSTKAYIIGSYLKGLSVDDLIINTTSGVMDGQIMNKSIGAMLVESIEKQCEPTPISAHHPLDVHYDLVLDESQLKLIIKP